MKFSSEVRPTGDKPVFCKDCFRENDGGEARRQEERNFSRPYNAPAQINEYKEQLDAPTNKIDKILDILTTAMAAAEPEEEIVVPADVSTPERRKNLKKAF